MKEKRVHPRVAINAPATYESGGSSGAGNATDLSMGGMFIEASTLPAFGAPVTVVIELESESEGLRVEGVVRWGKPGGFGVQFGLMGARETHALGTYLRRKQQQG